MSRFYYFNRYVFVIALLLLFTDAGFAQQDLNFTNISTKSGLSSNTVNAILKDKWGLMWFATADGLNRYDGTTFTAYRHRDNDSTSFPANEIMCLYEDKSGRLWVGTAEGSLVLYDRVHDSFKSFHQYGFGKGQRGETIRAISEDHLGRLWVSSYTGLSIIDFNKHKTTFFVLNSMYPDKGTMTALSLLEDKNNVMWIGTSAGLLRYNEASGTFTRYLHDDRNPKTISADIVKALGKDNDGKLWIGTANGLDQLAADGASFNHIIIGTADSKVNHSIVYAIAADKADLWLGTEDGLVILNTNNYHARVITPQPREMFSISDKSVRNILIDKKGIYWIGTFQGGINKYDKNLTLFNHKTSNAFDSQGLKSSSVTSFAQLDSQHIFVGTDNGGLQLYNSATGLFKTYQLNTAPDGDGKLSVLALKYTKSGKLWVGTYRQGVFIVDPVSGNYQHILSGRGSISQNDVFAIEEDEKGRIWVGTNGKGVDIYDPVTRQFTNYRSIFGKQVAKQLNINDFIRSMAVGNNGDMWVGTSGGGVTILNLNSGKVTLLNEWNSKLNSNVVLSILRDHKDNMWLGTNAGFAMIDKDQKHIAYYSEKDGLTNNVVHKILEDNNGLLWITTNKGINNYDPRTRKFNTFSHQNGVQDGPFINGSGIKTAGGLLFFGGIDGFNYFNPAGLPNFKEIPQVLLTDLRVANNKVSPTDKGPLKEQIGLAKEIKLAYGQNFAISYAAVNYTNPHQDQYSYMLKGFDKNWNYVGRSATAYYTNIDPGTYTFLVRASNSSGTWSLKPTAITVKILPPWWRTIYACLFYLLAGVGILFYIRHKGIKKIKNELALEEEKRESRRLHELDLSKINFLTNLSHEFRTPISLIMAPVDKLLSMQTDQNVAKEVNMINRNARRLLVLVNQLLDFRKMEEQELKLNLAEGDVIAFIRETVDSFKDLSERKDIQLVFNSHTPAYFTNFDSDKLERIIFNLLSNAFKFTHAGGKISVAILVPPQSTASEDYLFEIVVSDTGIGIPEDGQQKIFERFYQHSNTNEILNQGTGIGLSITKEFVELHGGQINLQSEPGKGTQIHLLFPFKPLADIISDSDDDLLNESDGGERLSDEAADHDKETVLLVEDNDDFRFYLKEALKNQYRILEAANGKEGWQKALSCHPDLIVTDISMPHMNGIDLCKKLKGDKRTSFIPVILLTALTGEQDQLRGLETGANDYLNKPFNFSVLSAKVANLIKLNQHLKTAFSKQIQIIQPEVQIESAEEKLLTKVAQFVDEKLNDPEFSIEELSKYMAMSRSSLYNKIFELTGLPPMEYVRSIKLKKAAVLLAKSQYTIREIAFMTGFGTPSYFSKLFKAKYNMSPSEYLTVKRKEYKSSLETADVE
ncbi:hybrid sensor histidine kinase/response regulator transcription factor [Mucilaginibacter sp. KACC 22063]|uniref:hybrid sensor histidine kinase/response regulator transcription factor n=1 Tax=Mucilaginibacter sp. KACC 22063 TaxID=3025666 RepID=UPI002366EDAC|nr:two-component regulator propeller domain-containing protein [Mucilaginibacter sp. KACC 22063]WDF56157.1 two-component regulator propeller domain-containing protein [Mucilaginibacter sp. KACC 22063]